MKNGKLNKALAALDQDRAERERPLTDKQREILEFVVAHNKRFGFPPTRNEIGKAFDIWDNGVQQHLLLIARKGYIKLSRAARAIEILKPI